MNNKEFSKELEKRKLKFGIKVFKLSIKLPNTPEARVVKTQITKPGAPR